MAAPPITVEQGVQACHARNSGISEKCNCRRSYQAWVSDPRTRSGFITRCASRFEARAWRQDALVGLRKGTIKAPTRKTLTEAANAWVEAVKDGSIRTRSGDFYKPRPFEARSAR